MGDTSVSSALRAHSLVVVRRSVTATAASHVCTPAPEPGASFPSAEDLELFIWGVPTTVVAQVYGVSDVAVGKWCRARNVSKLPCGFWVRCYADPDPVIETAPSSDSQGRRLSDWPNSSP